MVGRRRLKITQTWELDGYRVASADIVTDSVPANNSSSNSSGSPTAAAAAAGAGEVAAAGSADAAATAGRAEGSTAAAGAASVGAGGSDDGQRARQLAAQVLEECDTFMQRVRGVLASRRVGAGQVRELFER